MDWNQWDELQGQFSTDTDFFHYAEAQKQAIDTSELEEADDADDEIHPSFHEKS